LAPTASVVRTMVPRLPGSRTASSATQTSLPTGRIASTGVSRCSKTPSTVCGLSRRLIFSSTASLTAIALPPLAWAVATSRCTNGWFATALAWTSVRTVQPASTASATSFSPSARNSPDSLRFLASASPRISLTTGLARLVMCLTGPGAGPHDGQAFLSPPLGRASNPP
jgi:hypothetical protein